MRSKTLLAFAAASAFTLPAIHANAWDQSASLGSSDEASAANIGDQSGPMEQTWYYPDGTVAYHYPDGTIAYHQGDTVVVVLPDGYVSSSLAFNEAAGAAAASGDQLGMASQSPSQSPEPLTIGQAQQPDSFPIE